MADIKIANIKGPQGIQGETGQQGVPGEAATIEVGTVSTTAYGNTAQVTNTGTSSAAVFDFVIPQGRPGEETTTMSSLTLDTVTAQSAQYPVPATGESGSVVFGKIIKFFNDVKSAIVNKINYSDCVYNLTSTSNTLPLAASQGKVLKDDLAKKVTTNPPSGHTALENSAFRTSDGILNIYANNSWHSYAPAITRTACTVVTANSSVITQASGSAYALPYISSQVIIFMDLGLKTTAARSAGTGAFYLTLNGKKVKMARPAGLPCVLNGDGVVRFSGYSDSGSIRYITHPVAWEANKTFYISGVFVGDLVD